MLSNHKTPIGLVLWWTSLISCPALTILVDYSYDTNGFFPTGSAQRATLEAAANRLGEIITTPLAPVNIGDDNKDGRIGFLHPSTGLGYQISSAASAATDALAGSSIAGEYRPGGIQIPANTWVLYAGSRDFGVGGQAGLGGTGTGTNFSSIFSDTNSHLNRGFNPSGNPSQPYYLPVWGGSIAFSTSPSVDWHYDLATPSADGKVDFYSVALHEVGHALGLAAKNWKNFQDDTGGTTLFSGAETMSMYNLENGTAETSLSLISTGNGHWVDGLYQSNIFELGNVNYVGTVGQGVPQDLLMEPSLDFTASVRRFEITDLEVAALRDLGWSTLGSSGSVVDTVPEPSTLLALSSLVLILGPRRRRR